jgi:5-methylthioadenosine/S-adenosylhomocysteine deaminase
VLLRSADGRPRLVPAAVLVRDGRIVSVHEGPAPETPAGGVHDYGSDLITPAFVNAHTHLTMNFMRGRFDDLTASGNAVEQLFFRIETQLEAADVRAFTRMGAYECLLHGVATVWDHYYFGDAVAQGLRDVGLSGVVAPTLQDLSGPGLGQAEQGLSDTLAIASDPALARAGIFSALGPHASDTVSAELWSQLAQLAGQHELPLHFHLAQSPEEVQRVDARSGCSPVELLERAGILEQARVMAHGIYLSLADARRATARPANHRQGWLVFCPASQTQFGVPARIDEWLAADVPFLVASDSGNSNDGLNVQEELRWVAGFRALSSSYGPAFTELLAEGGVEAARRVGLARAQAVARLQRLSDADFLLRKLWDEAGALHPAFRTGTIAAGALANLAVWDLNGPSCWPATDPLRALAFSNLSHALRQLIVLGEPRGTDGWFASSIVHSQGYRDARNEADGRLQHLWRRAGF